MKWEKGRLPTNQITLLDKIGFSWKVNCQEWPKRYIELVEWYNEHGHLQVSQDDNPELYDWMTLQRKHYHTRGVDEYEKQAINELQIEKLEEINFCWSLDWKERAWHEKYKDAVEFYKEHGHVRVKKKENPSFYNWIATQKKRYKGTKGQKPLSQEELELLERIDFAFLENQPRMAWNARYAELERYREENDGRLPDHGDDPELNRCSARDLEVNMDTFHFRMTKKSF